MTDVQPITNDADYKRAQTRVREMMNNWADERELAELRALSKAVDSYARTRFDIFKVQTDGVNEIEYMLDQGLVTLDELLPVFGGMEQFLEFMIRRRNLEPATIDAIVANFNTKREWIDKPFCEPEGWKHITKEDSTCCDDDPCPMGIGEWRERLLAERARMEAADARHERVGAGRPVQDVGAVAAD